MKKFRFVFILFFLLGATSCAKGIVTYKNVSVPPGKRDPVVKELGYNEIISHSVTSNPISQAFDFQITYGEKPQFLVTDSVNRQAHAFQFYMAYDTTVLPDINNDSSWDVIIRGGEIYLDGTIRLRNPKLIGPGDGRESGGWGALMTPNGIHYQSVGPTIYFSIPWAVLGDPDGRIYYDLLNMNYGSMNQLLVNRLVDY